MNNWTREEEIVVFDLYCKIPFKKSSKTHPDVIRIANIIGRTPSSVNMKIGNFGSFDENLKQQGIVGLINASKLDAEIWKEFNEHWDELSLECERIIERKLSQSSTEMNALKANTPIPMGGEAIATVKRRINQSFFARLFWLLTMASAVLQDYQIPIC